MKRWLVLSVLCLVGASVCDAERPTNWGTPVTKTAVVTSNSTDSTLWDPDADRHIVLIGCVFSAGNAVNIQLEVSDVDVIAPMNLASGGTVAVGFGPFPIWEGAEDAVLTYTTVGSGTHSITCSGWEEGN